MDNPRLTVREIEDPNSPLRAILDPHLSLDENSHLLQDTTGSDILFYCLEEESLRLQEKCHLYRKDRLVFLPGDKHSRLNLNHVLQDLAKRGINSVLCEGGSKIAGQLIKNSLVDEIYWFIAPKLLPDSNSLGSTSGDEPINIEKVHQFKLIETLNFGDDTLIHLKIPD